MGEHVFSCTISAPFSRHYWCLWMLEGQTVKRYMNSNPVIPLSLLTKLWDAKGNQSSWPWRHTENDGLERALATRVTDSPPASDAPLSTAFRWCGACQLTYRTKNEFTNSKAVGINWAPLTCVSSLNLSNQKSKLSLGNYFQHSSILLHHLSHRSPCLPIHSAD